MIDRLQFSECSALSDLWDVPRIGKILQVSFHQGDAARPISYSISFVFRYPAPASESGIPFRGFYEQQSGAQ